jgi:signal peptidase II
VSASSSRPPASSGRRAAVAAAVVVAVVALDQLTKHWAVNALDDRTLDLVWTLRLNLTFNAGSAFSLGSSGGLFSLLGLVVVAVVFRSVLRWPGRLPPVALGLVLGGAVGNLTDRVFRAGGSGPLGGYVVDFIDPQWWPVFNVADIGVSIGAVLLIALSWRQDHRDDHRRAPAADPA